MLKLVRSCMAHGRRQLETGGSLLHGLQNWQQKGMYKGVFGTALLHVFQLRSMFFSQTVLAPCTQFDKKIVEL